MTITELLDALDGYGMCITDSDEIAERLFDLGLGPDDKLDAVDRWLRRDRLDASV